MALLLLSLAMCTAAILSLSFIQVEMNLRSYFAETLWEALFQETGGSFLANI